MRQLLPDDSSSELARLYVNHQQPVKGNLVKRGHEKEDAEDCYQDVFLSILEKSARKGAILPQDDDHCKHWLYRTATNRAVDSLRRRQKFDFIYLPDNEAYALFAELMVEGHEKRICDNDEFRKAWEQIPQQARNCLVLHKVLGHSLQETAEILQRCAKRMSLFITACFFQLEHSHNG